MRDNTCTLFCRSMCGIRIVGLRKRIHHQTLIIVRDQVEIISGIKSQVLQIIGSFPPVDTTFGSKSRLVACIVSYIESTLPGFVPIANMEPFVFTAMAP